MLESIEYTITEHILFMNIVLLLSILKIINKCTYLKSQNIYKLYIISIII